MNPSPVTSKGILEGVAPIVKDHFEVFVSRLKETTTSDLVKRHLHEHGIEVKDVFILKSKRQGTKSAGLGAQRKSQEWKHLASPLSRPRLDPKPKSARQPVRAADI